MLADTALNNYSLWSWVPAFALGHAHIWCGGLTRVGCGGFQNRESV